MTSAPGLESPSPSPRPAVKDLYIALALGLLITIASAAKPMGIDDNNFLAHGVQAGIAPLDPLGYETRYETWHETALRLPCPPVVQYWLGLGYAILGDHVALLKLWMGPWAVLLAWVSLKLARPWAGLWAVPAIAAVFITPIIFNSLNIMLDVPAAALMLAGVLTFRAYLDAPKPDVRLSLAAGGLAGLAMLAKYSACSGPLTILALAIAYRKGKSGILPGIIASIVFWTWELLVYLKYGHSQFFYSLSSNQEANDPVSNLLSFIGLPGTGAFALALLACLCLSAPSWLCWLLGLASLTGYASVFFIPGSQIWLGGLSGTAFLILFILCLRQSLKATPDADRSITLFLLAWVIIEMVQITVVSPFPAGRRMIAFTVILALVIARAGHLLKSPVTRPGLITLIALSLPITAITWYADLRLTQNIRDSLLSAADEIRQVDPRHENAKIYYSGLWNWQYYGPRYGLTECLSNQSVLETGDWLICVRSGMPSPGLTLDPQNYSRAGTLISKQGISLSFLPNYVDWTSIAYVGDGAIAVDILQTGKRHVPQRLFSKEEMLNLLKLRSEPLPVAATASLLFLAKTSPDPFHNPFADILIQWGEPWLKEGVTSPFPGDSAYTRDLIQTRKADLPPGVADKLLTHQYSDSKPPDNPPTR
jgi:hypothetical protein